LQAQWVEIPICQSNGFCKACWKWTQPLKLPIPTCLLYTHTHTHTHTHKNTLPP
jgi:hypothetical protein